MATAAVACRCRTGSTCYTGMILDLVRVRLVGKVGRIGIRAVFMAAGTVIAGSNGNPVIASERGNGSGMAVITIIIVNSIDIFSIQTGVMTAGAL